jgi:hypothetical protein
MLKTGLRAKQRSSKKNLKFQAANHQEKGLPPHKKVEVTKHGKIDGASDGKNVWDDAMGGLAPRLLNLAVVKVVEQSPVNVVQFRN